MDIKTLEMILKLDRIKHYGCVESDSTLRVYRVIQQIDDKHYLIAAKHIAYPGDKLTSFRLNIETMQADNLRGGYSQHIEE